MIAIVATAKPTRNSACLIVRTAAARSVRQGMIVDVKWSRAGGPCLTATFMHSAGLVSDAFAIPMRSVLIIRSTFVS